MHKILYKIRNFFFAATPKKTVGVRALIIVDNKILLIKHSYRKFWYMPGGGIETHESPLKAVHRELLEETNVNCNNFELFGLYYSLQENHDDFVALYIGHVQNISGYKIDEKEIAEINFFDLQNLPPDISPATKRRIDEYLGLCKKSDIW